MKYKVGDRVLIKSLDWYNKNKDNYGAIYAGNGFGFWKNMSRHCGEIMKITIVKIDPEDSNKGYYFMENCEERWTDEMIECKVEGIEDRMKELRKMCTISLTDSNYSDKIEVLLNDYEYIEENGKAYFVKKKKEYPKTYEECCTVLNTYCGSVCGYNWKLLLSFQQLLICRDAYWKIAGEEMGLGKPWEPDWTDYEHKKFVFIVEGDTLIEKEYSIQRCFLAFPTEKMRDAFYEVFREEIEFCKELL